MKMAVFSVHLGFFDPIADAWKKKGHEIRFWRESDSFNNGYQIANLLNWCDVAFVEFCQTPLMELIGAKKDFPDKLLVARMHRIEIYNELTTNKNLEWDKVDVLYASARHVVDRFVKQREGLSKPKEITIAATNIADPTKFKFFERKWVPPYRICLLGNFVPKKRQYTAIQMMHDVRNKFGDEFKLDIVGDRGKWTGYGNPEYFQNCQDLIEDLELSDIVTIYDKVPYNEVPITLNREHIILSNSNEEGTHVAIAEGAMTGCIPFVSHWRGANEIYGDIAWLFKSPGEFVQLCEKVKTEGEAAATISKGIADVAKEKCGRIGLYDRMVDDIVNSHNAIKEKK
jgi:glycosyltransferase involved in cell wall biosynthesis